MPPIEVRESRMPAWGLPALSWFVSLYFFFGFIFNSGFPPDRKLLPADILFVLAWLFFLFLPFFSKIRIGGFLELERKLEEAQQELKDFKAEIRSTISVLSTNVNTIGGLTNHVTVNLPGLSELRDARQKVEEQSTSDSKAEAKEVEAKLLVQSEDTTLALARTRIEIERQLRKILGKRTGIEPDKVESVKLMGTRQLFDLFLSKHERFTYLRRPFQYVIQVCNAAIHAQTVTHDQAQEALALGAQIIAVLNDLAPGQDPD